MVAYVNVTYELTLVKPLLSSLKENVGYLQQSTIGRQRHHETMTVEICTIPQTLYCTQTSLRIWLFIHLLVLVLVKAYCILFKIRCSMELSNKWRFLDGAKIEKYFRQSSKFAFLQTERQAT